MKLERKHELFSTRMEIGGIEYKPQVLGSKVGLEDSCVSRAGRQRWSYMGVL